MYDPAGMLVGLVAMSADEEQVSRLPAGTKQQGSSGIRFLLIWTPCGGTLIQRTPPAPKPKSPCTYGHAVKLNITQRIGCRVLDSRIESYHYHHCTSYLYYFNFCSYPFCSYS